MALGVKELVIKPDYLSSDPGTHKIEGVSKLSLNFTCVCKTNKYNKFAYY